MPRKNTQHAVGDFYSNREEWANTITHAFGILVSAIGVVILLATTWSRDDGWRFGSVVIYSVSLIALFSASTLYHGTRHLRRKRLWRRLDHAVIYVVIAGTYTPFLLVHLRTTLGWTLFVVVWLLALFGVVFKLLFTGYFDRLTTFAYVVMGWLAILALRQLSAVIETAGLWLLFAGGIVYTLGVVFFMWKRIPYNHALWHLFVLGGSVCHYLAILLYVI